MATTFIEPLRSAAQRVEYTEGGDAERALGALCDFGTSAEFCEFCAEMRRLHGRRVEAYGVRVSFSDAELSPDSPSDVQAALEFGYELCARIAPGCPVHVVAHGDGEGGKLHVHCEIANHDLETGRAIRANRSARHVRSAADGLARERGLSVIGETPERRERWAQAHGVKTKPAKSRGWRSKRGMPEVSDFERMLGDAVQSALDAATGVQDFKERLEASGVSLVEVPKREKDPQTGRLRDVIDPSTGAPLVACWRYVARDAGGRQRRRKDSNLSPEFRMSEVIGTLEARERAALARDEARASIAAEQARRAEAVRDLRRQRRPVVSPDDVSGDLDALFTSRRRELMGNMRSLDEPLMNELKAATISDQARLWNAGELQRALDAEHAARDGGQIERETPAQTLAAALEAVARNARHIVTRLLAMMWRMRVDAERERRARHDRGERERMAARAIRDAGRAAGPSRLAQESRQLEFTYKGRNRQRTV